MPYRDDRAEHLKRWLEAELGEVVGLEIASGDASARRYLRLSRAGGRMTDMDAPPPEDCAAFVRIGRMLRDAGVHAPRVHARNLKDGYLLLEDLGRQTYLDSFTHDNAWPRMEAAIEALLRWQCASEPDR